MYLKACKNIPPFCLGNRLKFINRQRLWPEESTQPATPPCLHHLSPDVETSYLATSDGRQQTSDHTKDQTSNFSHRECFGLFSDQVFVDTMLGFPSKGCRLKRIKIEMRALSSLTQLQGNIHSNRSGQPLTFFGRMLQTHSAPRPH